MLHRPPKRNDPGAHVLPGTVFQHLNYIVLDPVSNPTLDQIRAFRDLAPSLGGENLLEIRRILINGGYAAFGELLPDHARQISSRLSAAKLPHRIEQTSMRQIILPKGKDT